MFQLKPLTQWYSDLRQQSYLSKDQPGGSSVLFTVGRQRHPTSTPEHEHMEIRLVDNWEAK